MLFYNKVEVLTVSLVETFVAFYELYGKKCILLAHNGARFDHSRFLMAVQKVNMVYEYEQVIHRFADSLSMLKKSCYFAVARINSNRVRWHVKN